MRRGAMRMRRLRRFLQRNRKMKFWIVAAFLLIPVFPATSLGQDRGSQSDQDACRPEVFRLCADAIPDETEIVACLQRRVAELNPACRQVIDPAPHPKSRAKTTKPNRS